MRNRTACPLASADWQSLVVVGRLTAGMALVTDPELSRKHRIAREASGAEVVYASPETSDGDRLIS